MATALARNGTTSPFGKLTESIPSLRICGETKEILEREAKAAGLTLQEFIRDLLDIRAHGIDAVRAMYDARLRIVSGDEAGVVSGKSEES